MDYIAIYLRLLMLVICFNTPIRTFVISNVDVIVLYESPGQIKKQAWYVHNGPGNRENAARFINRYAKKQYHRAFKANVAAPGADCKASAAIAKEFLLNDKESLSNDKPSVAIAKAVVANVQKLVANDKLPRANAKDVAANIQELAANDKEFLAIAKDLLPNAGTPVAIDKDVVANDKTSAANVPGSLANAFDPVQNCENSVNHSMNLKEEKWNS